MTIDIILLDRKDLNSQSILANEEVLDRPKILPVWKSVAVRETHVQPYGSIWVVVFDRRDDSQPISESERSRDFRWERQGIC